MNVNVTRISLGATLLGVAVSVTLGMANGGAAAGKIDVGLPFANQRTLSPTIVAPGFGLSVIARGTDPVENPSGPIVSFGFLNASPLTSGTKTEPDENLYLVFDHNPGGPTPGYDYGRHFLFQGHENGVPLAYITRINLDVADPMHRITLLTPTVNGTTGFGSIDGSTWDPNTRTLLFTQERGTSGGVIQVTADWPPQVTTLDGILGKAGYEGIHPDNRGNLLIIEDTGGKSVSADPSHPGSPAVARQPNSFVYKFVPYEPTDLSLGGQLFALQVFIEGDPLVFHGGSAPTTADAISDVFSPAQLKLHTPGSSWPATWVLVHDTATDGTQPFDANLRAKLAGATPFKRPENAQYLPGSGFNTFFFDPTGDTDADSGNQPALAARGAWGSIFRVDFPGSDSIGTISLFFLGDATHAAFDNLAFSDERTLLAAEDRGDGLHGQLNRLDSIWAFDVRGNGSSPRRLVALGLDDLATSEDNEPTGLHVSDGAVAIQHLQGKPISPESARWFFTQQHGRNMVYEIVR